MLQLIGTFFRPTTALSLTLGWMFLAAAQAAEAPRPADSSLQALAYWAGGTWRGELPPGPGGRSVALETTFTWMENRQALRFDTVSVSGDRRAGYSSGIYGWHPGKKAISFWYFDQVGTLYEGTVRVEGDTLVHEFTATDRAGTRTPYQARITQKGPDTYENAILAEKDGKWEQMVVVRYERQGGRKQ